MQLAASYSLFLLPTIQAPLSIETSEWFSGSKTVSFKIGNCVIVLIRDGNMIKARTSAIV